MVLGRQEPAWEGRLYFSVHCQGVSRRHSRTRSLPSSNVEMQCDHGKGSNTPSGVTLLHQGVSWRHSRTRSFPMWKGQCDHGKGSITPSGVTLYTKWQWRTCTSSWMVQGGIPAQGSSSRQQCRRGNVTVGKAETLLSELRHLHPRTGTHAHGRFLACIVLR